ncbi:DHH family phosphoesterase [archaeon]|jgi:single-stranded DNA-specific DHH superfamily exonuclease|nr:DHH family phosphoesterase [archaeon]
MLKKKEIEEIREHLERAQNPVFMFDNDQDGLCSFLLLQRHYKRGLGVCIKSFPELDVNYFRKVEELNADYIFILDKPMVSEEFWKEVEQVNIPVVWIDHHKIDKKTIPEFVNYYNPIYSDGESEPVTVLCYEIVKKNKKDLWLAIVGAISDYYLPKYYKDFQKKYPDLATRSVEKDPFNVLFGSEIGKIAKMLGNGMKDTTTNVVLMLKFLMKVKSPYEVMEETKANFAMHHRSREIEKKYNILLEKAKLKVDDTNFLYFGYSGDLSISGELSNQLGHLYPEKTIIVSFFRGSKVNLSLRGKDVLSKFEVAIKDIKEGRGGGHKDAVGGQLHMDDLDKFVENMRKLVE